MDEGNPGHILSNFKIAKLVDREYNPVKGSPPMIRIQGILSRDGVVGGVVFFEVSSLLQ
jgi:hypothetical protein